MAQSKQGTSVQGCEDEGVSAALEFPVLIAGKDSVSGNKVVPTFTGGALVTTGGGGGGGAVTIADGADTVEGSLADAADVVGVAGTVNSKLRGLIQILADVWDNAGNFLRVSIQNATLAVTQSGAWTVDTELPAASALANGMANPTTPLIGACLMGNDTAGAWYRLLVASQLGDSSVGGQSLPVMLWMYNGATFERVRTANSADNTTGTGVPAAGQMVFDTTNWQSQLGDTSGRAMAVGAAANQAAVAGNPVWVAGSTTAAGGNLQGLVVESAVAPNLRVSLWNSTSEAGMLNVSGDGLAVGISLSAASYGIGYNGASGDKNRHNIDVTLLASASRTTTQTSADITTYNNQAITVILDMTNVAAAPSVTVTIDGKDPASGKYYNLLTGAAVVVASTNVYRVDPSVPAVANLIAQLRLPRIIRIVVTANLANAGTYSVGYTLHSPGG